MKDMNWMKKTLTLLCLLLSTVSLCAVTYKPTTVPIAHLVDSTRYVCNPDGILSESACRTIDAIFRAVEDSTGVEALVAVLGDIDPADCFTFARELGEQTGVGKTGRDNGIVILLSTTEREIRIVPGYGLEGVLPDAICKRIEVNDMVPSFAEGDWDTGMVNGARALMPYLLDPELAAADAEEHIPIGAIIGFLLFPVFFIVFIIRREKRCPACGKYKVKQSGSETLYSDARGKKLRYTYVCKNCGHTHHRDIYISKSSGPTVGGGFGGTIGGGSFGGGGFAGGHYGGGHFGGGGAGTRF